MSFWKPGDKEPSAGQPPAAPPAAAPPASAESKLSKSVMSMKFMARKRNLEQNTAEDQTAASGNHGSNSSSSSAKSTDLQLSEPIISASGARIVKVRSDEYSSLPGRRSFGGFNPAVERNYAKLTGLHMLSSSGGAGEGGIDDEAMLERYESLIGLPRGPNQGRFVPKLKKSKHER